MLLKKDNCALTPPMGWNSWDCYASMVTEEQLLGNAEYMATNLKQYGWQYVVCDIQWSDPHTSATEYVYAPFAKLCTDEYGRQIPAINRFPSSADGKGFTPIADKVHALGLKFGIHIMRGIPRQCVYERCPVLGTNVTADMIANPFSISRWNGDMFGVDYRRPGAQEYYNSLFQLYASWNVDFVKVDDICNTNMYPNDPYSAEKEIELIHNAIRACGREMVLSLSPGPAVIEKAWHLSKYANMWRITDDFWDDWRLLKAMFERCEVWQAHVKPGCWPDCDMLPLGHIGMGFKGGRQTNFTPDEQKTMLTLWSIFRSPLILGGELRDTDPATLALITNPEVLRLNAHSYGAWQLRRTDVDAAWASLDEDGSTYAALFNLSDEPRTVALALDEVGISNADVRDVWARKDVMTKASMLNVELPAHASCLYKLTAKF